MTKIAFVNPISPALHTIPGNCPLCGEQQWDGIHAIGGEIQDVSIADTITVAHHNCIQLRELDKELDILRFG